MQPAGVGFWQASVFSRCLEVEPGFRSMAEGCCHAGGCRLNQLFYSVPRRYSGLARLCTTRGRVAWRQQHQKLAEGFILHG